MNDLTKIRPQLIENNNKELGANIHVLHGIRACDHWTILQRDSNTQALDIVDDRVDSDKSILLRFIVKGFHTDKRLCDKNNKMLLYTCISFSKYISGLKCCPLMSYGLGVGSPILPIFTT